MTAKPERHAAGLSYCIIDTARGCCKRLLASEASSTDAACAGCQQLWQAGNDSTYVPNH